MLSNFPRNSRQCKIKLGRWGGSRGKAGGGGLSLFKNEKEIILMIIIINVSFPIHFCLNSVNAGKECKPE